MKLYSIIFHYMIILSWYLYSNIFGIIVNNYFKFDFIDIYIFISSNAIYSFLIGFIMTIFDKTHPKDIIIKLLNLNCITKFKLFIASMPIAILYYIVYIYLDPAIVQIISGSSIIFNLILSVIINKNYYLLNYKIILCTIINIIGCILPFIIDIKNNIKIGIIGIVLLLLLLSSSSIVSVIIENFKLLNEFNMLEECFTFSLFIFLFNQIIVLILCSPIVLLFDYHFDINRYFFINSLAIYYAILNSPLYIYSSYSMILLSSVDIGIINGIKLIILVFISCIMKFSIFNYIYIISLILIIISSLIIIYYQNKLNLSVIRI